MSRKNPNARRATALILLASLALAAQSSALLFPTTAQAVTTPSTTGRRPLPGDPNTPDEGGRTGSTTLSSAQSKSTAWFIVWIKGIAHLTFIAR
jgi:hypothetical protein